MVHLPPSLASSPLELRSSLEPEPSSHASTPLLPAQMAANASLTYSEMQLPMLMRSLYGRSNTLPKFVFMLRDPAMRFYSAYFG